MIGRHVRELTPCHGRWVALGIDVSPFHNSGTEEEGVSWTYKKVDGCAPIFAYLGEEGYLVHCQLLEGKQHGQDDTPEFLKEAIGYAKQITAASLLVRRDAGDGDLENMKICRKQ